MFQSPPTRSPFLVGSIPLNPIKEPFWWIESQKKHQPVKINTSQKKNLGIPMGIPMDCPWIASRRVVFCSKLSGGCRSATSGRAWPQEERLRSPGPVGPGPGVIHG